MIGITATKAELDELLEGGAMKKKCETCVFCYKEHEDDRLYFECRLNPPVPSQNREDGRYWGVFSTVYSDDWCGQWKGDPLGGE